MKILWLTVDRSNRVAHHFDDFRKTALKFAEVTTLFKYPAGDKGQNMWKISRALIRGDIQLKNIVLKYLNGKEFDFIFCDAFFAYINEDWDKINVPTGILIEDIHYEVPKNQIKEAYKVGIKNIFHRFNFTFHKFHPKARLMFNCFWLPHSVKMKRYYDKIEKDKEVLHVGVSPNTHYPWRYKVIKELKHKKYFTFIKRPKDKSGLKRSDKWPIDKDYDNLLKSSKICITGGSIYNVPVQKYVEIPASGSLLMSNWFSDLGLLGFKDQENMIVYCMEDIVDKVENLLKDEDKISKIAKYGYELILNNHTS